jgi:hypothetical protein
MASGIFARRRRHERLKKLSKIDHEYAELRRAWRRDSRHRHQYTSMIWVENQNKFADKHCVLCKKLLNYRVHHKHYLCKKCWTTIIHPELIRKGFYREVK